jgi:hypothetical protein
VAHSWVGLDGDEGEQKGKKTIAHLHYLVFLVQGSGKKELHK